MRNSIQMENITNEKIEMRKEKSKTSHLGRYLPLFFALCSLFIFSCANPFEPPQMVKSGGTGYFSLALDGAGSGRTIMPETVQSDFQVYTLEFRVAGANTAAFPALVRTNANLSDSITLKEGTWDLYVSAYMDAEGTKMAAQGKLTGILINANQTTNKTILLAPIADGGEGTFSWDIAYPENVTAATMTITGLPITPETTSAARIFYFIPTDSSTDPTPQNSFTTLDSGSYRVVFKLENVSGLKAERWETLHIYQNMESAFACTFEEDHFNSALIGTVGIIGPAVADKTLKVNTTELGGDGEISYQWNRVASGSSTAISGATSATYTVQAADVGLAITVTVTRPGYNGSVTSDPTITVISAIVEEVSLTNSFYAVYRFDLPIGAKWEDYSGLTVDYKIDDADLLTTAGSSRGMRLMGPYVMPNEGDFKFFGLDDGSGRRMAVADYNAGKNAPFIIDELSSGQNATIKAVAESAGVENVTAGQWFTLPYKTDGSRANSGFSGNMPSQDATGPFYFGVGWTGNMDSNITTVQQIRNVSLLGANETGDLIGYPAIFEDQAGNRYPVFTGYPDSSGGNGVNEAARATKGGTFSTIKVRLNPIPSAPVFKTVSQTDPLAAIVETHGNNLTKVVDGKIWSAMGSGAWATANGADYSAPTLVTYKFPVEVKSQYETIIISFEVSPYDGVNNVDGDFAIIVKNGYDEWTNNVTSGNAFPTLGNGDKVEQGTLTYPLSAFTDGFSLQVNTGSHADGWLLRVTKIVFTPDPYIGGGGGIPVTGTWGGLTIPASTSAYSYATFQGKNNVLQVSPQNGTEYEWAVFTRGFSGLTGEEITIEVSMDVWLDKEAKIAWQANSSGYPLVAGSYNSLSANQWHTVSNIQTITLQTGGSFNLYLSGGGSGGQLENNNVQISIANVTVQFDGGMTYTSNSSGNKPLPGSDYGYEMYTLGGNNNKLTWYGPDKRGGAAFKAEWNDPDDFIGRVGYFWNHGGSYTEQKNIYVQFDYTRTGRGTAGEYSFIGIYGWSRNESLSGNDQLVEYYIVEDWFGNSAQTDTVPMSMNEETPIGTFEMDGATYKIYQRTRTNQPSIDGTKTFTQIFSVRQDLRQSGTISVTKHFEKWNDLVSGCLEDLYECKFLVEAGGGTGSLDLSWLSFTQEDTPRTSLIVNNPAFSSQWGDTATVGAGGWITWGGDGALIAWKFPAGWNNYSTITVTYEIRNVDNSIGTNAPQLVIKRVKKDEMWTLFKYDPDDPGDYATIKGTGNNPYQWLTGSTFDIDPTTAELDGCVGFQFNNEGYGYDIRITKVEFHNVE